MQMALVGQCYKLGLTMVALVVLQESCIVHGRDRYVSENGTDSATCGLPDKPCKTLEHVLTTSLEGNTLNLVASNLAYRSTCGNVGTVDSIRLIGHSGSARIGCYEHVPDDTILRVVGTGQNSSVVLENLIFENGTVYISNCTVQITNVTFLNSTLQTGNCETLDLLITQSTWRGISELVNGSIVSSRETMLKSTHLSVKLEGSQFYSTRLNIEGTLDSHILVNRCNFTNLRGDIPILGGLNLQLSNFKSNVTIKSCNFWRLTNPNRVQSLMNLHKAALMFRTRVSIRGDSDSNATVLIRDVVFEDDERGITAIGPHARLEIENCMFRRNLAMHAGAAILVLIDRKSSMTIRNCTFENNGAGKYRDIRHGESEGDLWLEGDEEGVKDEVRVNSSCCKGVVQMVAKGGAIRVQRGTVFIYNTKFVNNTARLLGGALFLDHDSNLGIYNCSFTNSDVHENAQQGDVIYSDGLITLRNIKLDIATARSHQSIVRHAGDHWSMNISNVWIQCPVNFNVRVTNTTAYGVHPSGLRRSHLMDQLSYFCEPCPRSMYSVDRGFINYTATFAYFSHMVLLTNGSQPKDPYTGTMAHHRIRCTQCPYGGHCDEVLTARPGYWGYQEAGRVRFQHCPKGYCSSHPAFPSKSPCSQQRVGKLCGRCMSGYTEALFSTKCISNDRCGIRWLAPFVIFIGFIYVVFLLFQTDINRFLDEHPVKCERFLPCFPSESESDSKLSMVRSGTALDNQDERIDEQSTGTLSTNLIRDETTTTQAQEDSRPVNQNSYLACIVILFFYFQDAFLLHVETPFSKEENHSLENFKNFFMGLFIFRLDLFHFNEEACTMQGWGPVSKVIIKTVTIPYILILFGGMYLVYRIWLLVRSSPPVPSSALEALPTRIATGVTLAIVLSFQKVAIAVFTLLNCVSVQGESRIFIDGTLTCYQSWQYVVLMYVLLCTVPFFLVLTVGPALLESGQIGLVQFVCACVCPLPILVAWLLRYCWNKARRTCTGSAISDDAKAVAQMLQGPYTPTRWRLCWSGVLLGRRLILVLLYTFIVDSLIRLLCMLLACLVILLHNVLFQPYKGRLGNMAASASAASLVALSCINLVRAGFKAADYTPLGPNLVLMRVFIQLDNLLLVWLPLCLLVPFILLLLIRISFILFRRCFPEKGTS